MALANVSSSRAARCGQHTVVGSMTVLLALFGNMPGEGCREPYFLYKPTAPRFRGELPGVGGWQRLHPSILNVIGASGSRREEVM